MAEPTYPLFLFDGLDLIVVSSEEKLQTNPESVDVRSEIFETYDSEGRRVHLTSTRWKTSASVDPSEPIASGEFEARLRAFLKAVGDPAADDPECQLRCIMEACQKRA